MKKIICLLGLIAMMQNGFAKCQTNCSYHNYTQNIDSGGLGYNNINVLANPGDSVVFDAYDKFGINMPVYTYPAHWYLEGNSIPNSGGQQFLSVLINQSGTYSALINSSYCGSYTIYFYVTNVTGIPSIKNINFLNIFPTAVTSSITIQLNSIKSNDLEISFFDMNGRQLKNDFYKNVIGEFIKKENTEALAKGIYFLRIKSGNDVVEKKFVKR